MGAPWTRKRRTPPRHTNAEVATALIAQTPTIEAEERAREMVSGWDFGTETPATGSDTRRRQQARAMKAEARARADLAEAGYLVTRSHESQTAADLVATKRDDATPGPLVLHVQVKSLVSFHADALNDAYCRFEGLGNWKEEGRYAVGTGAGRQVWLWQYDVGWIAKVRLTGDGDIEAHGPRAEEVRRSIERRRRYEERRTTKQDERLTFEERLRA